MTNKPYLLCVEDDPGIQAQLKWCFENHEVISANNRKEAIALFRRYEPGVVTLDLGLPPDPDGVEEGFQTLVEILRLKSLTKVIVVTGQSTRAHAVAAIGAGAYDHYVKPIDKETLELMIKRAYYIHDLENERLNNIKIESKNKILGLISCADNMQKLCQTIEKIAPTDITTLLRGESGTGKEVLARGIHSLSPRSKKAFVAINCAAIPENLLESELFGFEKGAFTGAVKSTPGKIELSHEGTLFLDEIGDLPLSLQPKLLRFLQERKVERLGGRKELSVDVRVICATNQPLQELIKAQTFREDLYYRISEMSIAIPPLHERENDALIIAQYFFRQFSKLYNPKLKGFTDSSKEAILRYSWPGNVRELENKVKRAVIMAEKVKIGPKDLELPFIESGFPFNLKEVRDEAERNAIKQALIFCSNNMSKASELLGITRPTLYHMIEKLNLNEESLNKDLS